MKHKPLTKRDIALKTERYQDALEKYKDDRWAEVAAMEPEAVARLLVETLGMDKFDNLVATFLFDPLAEAEFESSLEADDDMGCDA